MAKMQQDTQNPRKQDQWKKPELEKRPQQPQQQQPRQKDSNLGGKFSGKI
jgi:hypothetical protein